MINKIIVQEKGSISIWYTFVALSKRDSEQQENIGFSDLLGDLLGIIN